MRAAFVFASLALVAYAGAQDYGLLLGLSNPDGEPATVFVHKKGVATFAKEVGKGYWLWRDKGFVKVTTEGATEDGARAVHISFPDGKRATVQAEEGRPDTFYEIAYVSPFSIGLVQSMQKPITVAAGTGRGFEDVFRYPTVFRNLQWSDTGVAVEVGQAFDEKTVAEFHRVASSQKNRGALVEEEASPTNWTLFHGEGKWQLFGKVLPRLNEQRNQGTNFFVATVTDAKFGGTEEGPRWTRVRSEYPDVLDVTTSPNGKLTIVVTSDSVFVHESSSSALGRRLRQIRLPVRGIVMTQWLESEAAAKVAAALDKD